MSDKSGFDGESGLIDLGDGVLFGWTKDYSLFEFDPANRPINQRNLASKLKKVQQKASLLKVFPVVVVDCHGKWLVRDGQHRVRAAEAAGETVYFMVTADMDDQDVLDVNNSQFDWTVHDRMHHFIAQGRPEYLKLQAFVDRHPWMRVGVARELCTYGNRTTLGFDDGTYQANDLDFAESVAQLCEAVAVYTPGFNKEASFVYSLAMCLEHAGFDPARLVRKVAKQQDKLHKCGNVERYLELWNDIYNAYQKEDDQLMLSKLGSNSKRRRPDRRFRNRMGVK